MCALIEIVVDRFKCGYKGQHVTRACARSVQKLAKFTVKRIEVLLGQVCACVWVEYTCVRILALSVYSAGMAIK